MKRRGTSASSKDDTNVKRVIRELQERSIRSLRIARDTVLGMRVESKQINDAIKHYVKNWNDYVHPGLMSVACEAVGGNPDEVVPMQVVMLLLTAAADIHDDIIDESKTKYRKLTVFGKFSKDIALLVGDAFLLRGMTFFNETRYQIPESRAKAVWNIIFSRIFELGDAEAIEVSKRGNVNVSPEEYLRILEMKASIFEGYMRIGALIGGGDQDAVDLLGSYGKTLGILLSIREDVVDTFEPDELQNRMRNECLPLPILYAFKNPLIKKTLLNYLSKPKISNKDAERIVDIVFNEKNAQMLKNKIGQMVEKANASIAVLKNENLKSQLNTLTKGIIEEL
jgi:geranylgeranyl diphosphate synthase type I